MPTCPTCTSEATRLYRPSAPQDRRQIASPDDAAEFLVPDLGGLDREHGVLVSLDTKHRLLATTTVSIGSVDHTFFAPREVFLDALHHGASAILLAHNHPSGDPEPSADDAAVTRRIATAGTTLGIELLDHIVIGHESWVSLARSGCM